MNDFFQTSPYFRAHTLGFTTAGHCATMLLLAGLSQQRLDSTGSEKKKEIQGEA